MRYLFFQLKQKTKKKHKIIKLIELLVKKKLKETVLFIFCVIKNQTKINLVHCNKVKTN